MFLWAFLMAAGFGLVVGVFVFWDEFLKLKPVADLHDQIYGPKDVEVSAPFNAHHKVHVNRDMNWKGEDPTHSLIIEERLGSGSFGSVYKARHKDANFVIALKEVEMEGNEADRSELKAEIEILRQCKDPNIVNYYGCYFRQHELLIMMDYCAVGSVRDGMVLLGRGLTEQEIAHICYQALKGLLYLHSRSPAIVHRDVKAANILINEQGEVKIADFGVSDRIQQTVAPGGHVGTLFWMAPEMLKKTPFNQTADIWSLGITAIEMAEGNPPRSEFSIWQAVAQIPRLPAPTLAEPSKWSPEFNRFIARCLTKEYKQRPTALDLLKDPFILGAIRIDQESIMKARAANPNSYISALTGVPGANSVLKPFVADVLHRRVKRAEQGQMGTVDGTFPSTDPDLPGTSADSGTMVVVGDNQGTVLSDTMVVKDASIASTLTWNGTPPHTKTTSRISPVDSVIIHSEASPSAGKPSVPPKPHPLAGIQIARTAKTPSPPVASSPNHSPTSSSSGSTGVQGKINIGRRLGVIMEECGTQTVVSTKARVRYWGTIVALSFALSLLWHFTLVLIRSYTDENVPTVVHFRN